MADLLNLYFLDFHLFTLPFLSLQLLSSFLFIIFRVNFFIEWLIMLLFFMAEYAYTMKVTEKCDIYSYGVVLLELLTGRTPVQSLDQGGDLVTWVRHYVQDHSLTSGILDSRLNLQDRSIVDHMLTVLKIALICTSTTPFDRPSIREVVLMLIESNEQEGDFIPSPTYDLPLKVDTDLLKDDEDLPLKDDTRHPPSKDDTR